MTPNDCLPNTLSVDASCIGNPGDVEYRGVLTHSRQEVFRIGPLKHGTNNIGEFLAIVHGLAFLQQRNSNIPIYSDSATAIKWVLSRKCNTRLKPSPNNARIFLLIARAEQWLHNNPYPNDILKWQTNRWGNIPADFGRK